MQTKFLIGGLVLAALIIGGVWMWQQKAQPVAPQPVASPAVPIAAVAPKAEPEPEAEPQIAPLPALDDSDEFVRESVTASVAQGPESGTWQKWLALDDLARRFAVVVENATRREYPRRQLSFLAPAQPFKVKRQGAKLFIDPQGYRRYDAFVEALLSIPPKQAAQQLKRFEPLLVSALAELGVRDTQPMKAFQVDIDGVLRTPLLQGDVELIRPKVMYQFADPELEALPELSKQLLRMGPGNLLRIKAYLKDLRAALLSS